MPLTNWEEYGKEFAAGNLGPDNRRAYKAERQGNKVKTLWYMVHQSTRYMKWVQWDMEKGDAFLWN